jgi:L-ascorbate metabolism protein UlaG (beta-lactamase superfamily)
MAGKEAQIEGLKVQWIDHSTVKIKGKQVLYIDPFSQVLKGDEEKADLIISTHDHFDHFDPKAINSLSKEDTEVVCKKGAGKLKVKTTEINIGEEVEVKGIKVRAVHAYNEHRFRSPGQPFHPKGFGMGVVVEMEGVRFYYAGDTDFIPEMKELQGKVDIAFLPIGGTYTMDADEAVKAALAIKPKVVIPTHYNFLPETKANPEEFERKLDGIEVRIL